MILAASILMALLFNGGQCQAQVSASAERKVKVAYLYNFIRYVQWPNTAFQSASSPFVIGILANDPHGRILDQVAAKKKARGRQIKVRRFKSVQEIQGCHLIFISSTSGVASQTEAIAITEGQRTLLVCDDVPTPTPGAPIRFFADSDGTIGLIINIDAMGRRGLRADAKLLNVASIVRG